MHGLFPLHSTWSVVVSLTCRTKEGTYQLANNYFFLKREVDKVGLLLMNITTHIIQGSGTGPADLAATRPMFAAQQNQSFVLANNLVAVGMSHLYILPMLIQRMQYL